MTGEAASAHETAAVGHGIVLVAGPPGSGKGTQCEILAAATGWHHLSSGERFRDEIARGTSLGQRIEPLLRAGSLVPDDLVLEVILGALGPLVDDGVLLDGFPRTLPQARALLRRLPRSWLRLAIELVVPPDVALARLRARARSDDGSAAIRRRLELYETETRPALHWLGSLGLLAKIDGNQDPDAVQAAIRRRIEALDPSRSPI